MSRRRFLQTAGLAAGTIPRLRPLDARTVPVLRQAPERPRGPASNRVRLGFIGFGAQGVQLARRLPAIQGTEVVAVADLYDGRLRRAQEIAGNAVQVARDWRRVLDRQDIDAVIVATPDHWHATITEAALSADKDVYCECPVAHHSSEGNRLISLAVEHKCVAAGGGGWITSPVFEAARDLITTGRIGRITVVRASWDTSSSLGAWRAPFPPDASPDTIDFATFARRAGAPFDPTRFFRWRCYRDYGSGLAGARFAPQLTAVHWLLGATAPVRVTAAGTLLRWKDGREVPDTLDAMLEYPEGFSVLLSATQNGTGSRELRLMGTEGTLVIDDRGVSIEAADTAEPYSDVGETWSKEYRDWFYMMHGMTQQGQLRTPPAPRPVLERLALPADTALPPAHLADFVDAVRTRRAPRETLSLALQAGAAAESIDRAIVHSASEKRQARA